MRRRSLITFLTFALVIFVTTATLFASFGLYIDDWMSGTYLYAPTIVGGAATWVRDFRIEINNFRPLEIILPVLYGAGFSLAGLAGVNFITFLFFLLLCWLIVLFLQPYVSRRLALLSGVLFAVLPLHTFSLWQNGAHYLLGFAAMLGSVLAYQRHKKMLALLLITCALFMNESSIPVCLLALLPANAEISWPIIRDRLKSFLFFFVPVGLVYVGLRLGAESLGLLSGHSIATTIHGLSLSSYLGQFINIILLSGLAWAQAAWKIISYGDGYTWLLGALVAVLLYYWWRSLPRESTTTVSHLPILLLFGVLILLGGRYYSFANPVGLTIFGFNSRFFLVSSFGLVIIVAALVQYVEHRLPARRHLTIGFLGLLIVTGAMFKLEVQRDFVRSWQEGREMWRQIAVHIPRLPNQGTFVIDMPDRRWGVVVNQYDGFGTFAESVDRFYGSDVSALYAVSLRDLTVQKNETCFIAPNETVRWCVNHAKLVWASWDGSQLHLHRMPPPAADDIPLTLPPRVQEILDISS